jgi:predicted DNA-binding transcriptional regulator YafY
MAQNKNALIRYKTIDKCLQNLYRKWTLDTLVEACSDALYEYEGKDSMVSKRTIQLDIQLMRSDKLGYNAPIICYDKKYYKYEDPSYSITNIPITDSDMQVLSKTVEMLKQFKDFSLFSELTGIIQRLEDKVHTEKTKGKAIIHLDKNEQLKGLDHLDALYQAILKKHCLKLEYQSFKSRKKILITFHPYILKEYNNRWFLVGKKHGEDAIITLALDRIMQVDYELHMSYQDNDFDGDRFYENTIGVTVLQNTKPKTVILKFDRYQAPYVLTKPLHTSQEILEKISGGGITIQLHVHHNFELERLILGFGDGVEVIKPKSLRDRIAGLLVKALKIYEVANE